jgi:hypothetical protein
MALEPKVWGPHYWFVLHTIALTYPLNPNDCTKKKYYDFFNNLPLFVPVENIGNSISKLLDEYPVTPYLDSRDSLIKWVHFIHNKVNFSLGIKEITLEEAMSEYYNNYKPKEITVLKDYKQQEKYVFYFILLSLGVTAFYLYKK